VIRTARRTWAWAERRPLAADTALAAVLLALAAVSYDVWFDELERSDPSFRPDPVAVAAALAAMVGPLAFRRRFPLLVLAVSAWAYVVSGLVLGPVEGVITPLALALAVYSAAAHGRPRRRDWCAAPRSWASWAFRCTTSMRAPRATSP
jgi:hypothetical protein